MPQSVLEVEPCGAVTPTVEWRFYTTRRWCYSGTNIRFSTAGPIGSPAHTDPISMGTLNQGLL